jgi:hypothetical protein
MKRSSKLLIGILGSASLLFAADQNKDIKTKNGSICDAQCVTKVNDRNTCNPTCTEKSGEAVFVDDDGTVMKIENQAMAKPHMGKRVNMKCTEAQRENTLRILELSNY